MISAANDNGQELPITSTNGASTDGKTEGTEEENNEEQHMNRELYLSQTKQW